MIVLATVGKPARRICAHRVSPFFNADTGIRRGNVMNNVFRKLLSLQTAIAILFGIPNENEYSVHALASYRHAALRTVSHAVYLLLAFVALLFVTVLAMAAALKAAVPPSAYLVVQYGVLTLVLWFAAEIMYFAFMCNPETIRTKRSRNVFRTPPRGLSSG